MSHLEQSIIGNILLDNNKLLECSKLKPEHFEDSTNSKLYDGILARYKGGNAIDIGTFAPDNGLDRDYLLFCISRSNLFDFTGAVEKQIQTFKDSQKKKIIQNTLQANETEFSEALTKMQAQLLEIDVITNKKDFLKPESEVEAWLLQKAENLALHRLPLPFEAFKQAQNEVKIGAGWLVTIGARPKMGKSTLSLQIALETAKQGKKVLFFSLEMNKEEIYDKAIAYLGELPPSAVANWGSSSPASQHSNRIYSDNFAKGMEKLKKLNFLLFSESSTIWEITNMIKREEAKGHVDLIVVDQLSFIQTDNKFIRGGNNKVQEYDYIARQLKIVAKDNKTPIILLAQLNREIEKRGDELPKISDLKDSGGIEETSDMIFLLHKKETKASIFVTSRHESGGKYDLSFNTRLAKFED